MATILTLDEHLDALADSGKRLIETATAAGWDAPVPTCPAWSVRALVAHQAMVHRWATAHVTGADQRDVPSQTELRGHQDLAAYFREGLDALVTALRAAPPDLKAMRFLKDAPPPREFWARRQAHETTIHMADAFAAAGQLEAVDVDRRLAEDGVDELLAGFFARGRSKLYAGSSYDVLVAASDADARWQLTVAPELTVRRLPPDEPAPDAAVMVSGTTAALYLGLWNRGDEIEVTGESGAPFADLWRSVQRVRWS